ncbi:MAG: tetratricopeptide repeat protein [Candidatus Brocadiia bacterium]
MFARTLFACLCLCLLSAGVFAEDVSSAREAFDKGDFAKVVAVCTALLEKGANAEAYYLRAKAYISLGKPAEAEKDFAALFALIPGDMDGNAIKEKYPFVVDASKKYFPIVCPFDLSRWGPKSYTLHAFSFDNGRFERSVGLVGLFMKVSPENVFNMWLTKILLLKDNFNDAQNYIFPYVKDNPEDAWGWKLRADTQRELAARTEDRRASGKFLKGALDDYNRAIDMSGSEPAFFYNRGLYYLQQNNKESAMRDFRKALDIDPKYVAALFDFGLLLRDTGYIPDAVDSFSRAIAADPEFGEAYYQRGFIYFAQMNKIREAIADLQKAAELVPCTDVWSLLGDALKKGQQYDKAIAAYTKALEWDPQSDNSFYRRGDCYGLMAEWDKCVADLTQAIALGRDNDAQYYYYWFTRGKYRQLAARHKEAIADFEKTWDFFVKLRKYQAMEKGEIKSMDEAVKISGQDIPINLNCILALWEQSANAIKDADAQAKCKHWYDFIAENMKSKGYVPLK